MQTLVQLQAPSNIGGTVQATNGTYAIPDGGVISVDPSDVLFLIGLGFEFVGGSGLEFTDGTHDVKGATKLTITGGTVGGTAPNATLDISGGGGSLTVVPDFGDTVENVTTLEILGRGTNGGGGLCVIDQIDSLLGWYPQFNAAGSFNAQSILYAGGPGGDIDAIICPAENGAFILLVPDGGAGGNARGASAVDLQLSINKGSPTTVASGQYAYCEGNGNTASNICSHAEGDHTISSALGTHSEGLHTTAANEAAHAEGSDTLAQGFASHAEGSGTTASDGSAHAEGSGTTASGGSSHAEGDGTTASGSASHAEGINTLADANSAQASGQDSWVRGIFGAQAYSTGDFAAQGDQQVIRVGLKGETTDATPLVLTSNASGASTNNQLVLVDNETIFAEVCIMGKTIGAGDVFVAKYEVVVQRGTGVASTAIPTTTPVTPALISTYATAGAIAGSWAVALSADTTNGALQVTVTGQAVTNINWTAEVRTRELVF